MKAVISGTLADGTCDECESIPATYIMPQRSSPLFCYYELALCNCEAAPPSANTFVRLIVVKSGSDYILRFDVSITTSVARYEANLGTTAPNCLTFSNVSLSYVSGDAMTKCGTTGSDWSDLTVTITSIAGPEDNDDKQCGYCEWQTMPYEEVTAEISGSPGDVLCVDCDDRGGAVTLSKAAQADCCKYRGTYVPGTTNCTAWTYDLEIKDGEYELIVSVAPGGFGIVYANTGLAKPYDCSTASTSLSYVSDTDGGTWCTDWSGTSAVIVPV